MDKITVETRNEMYDLLTKIDPEFVSVAKGCIPLPRMADLVALNCWLKIRSDDKYSVELRRQMNHANKHGMFDFC